MYRPVILEQLEQGTRDLHARIERRVPLLDPNLHLDTYRTFLESMFGFYQPFEDALAIFPWHGTGLDFDQRRKARLLMLGLSPASGCAFLAGYGNAVGCMWRTSGEVLARAAQEIAGPSTGTARGMVTAARDTFAKLERRLAGTSPSCVGSQS
jgi:heme oxygenase